LAHPDRTAYLDEPLAIGNELKKLFRGQRTLTIADIGACEAEDSIRYSRVFPQARIYAFEPLPSNIAIAKDNIRKYNLSNIELVGKAVSDKNGTAKFFVSTGQPSGVGDADWDWGNKSSSLLEPGRHPEFADFIKFEESINVDTVTLDEFCLQRNITAIDFIHMDVQGGEMMVLKGAARILRTVRAIWLEVSTVALYKDQPLADELEKFMHDNEFVMIRDRLYGISGERLYISRSFFPKYRRMFPSWTKERSFLRRVLRKAGF
jgi:2-O-methyltransferase